MTTYIYHSEKTKTTCEECKKHDNKVYYDIKDIPKLPVHPNCKCWIETIEDKKDNNNTTCDCKERLNIIQNNIENLIINSDNILKNTDNEIYESEIKINEIKEDNNNETNLQNIQNIQNKLINLKEELQAFIKQSKDLNTDILFLKDNINEFTHTKEECNTDKELNNINNKSKTLLDSINKYSETLKQLREDIKGVEKNTVKEEGTVTGGASNINNKTGRKAVTPKERLYMEAGKIVSPFFKLAGANLQDAVNDFKYAKENKHAYVLDSRDEVKNAEINKILDDIKVPKDSRGVYYDINSEESKALWKTNEIQNILKENYDKLKNNEKKLSINVNFTNKGDFDAHLALQHCKLINPKITSDGYFEGIIVDYYDFNYRTPEIKAKDIKNMHDIKDWAVNEANNWGYSMQKNSSIENYFIIYHIKEKCR